MSIQTVSPKTSTKTVQNCTVVRGRTFCLTFNFAQAFVDRRTMNFLSLAMTSQLPKRRLSLAG